MSDGFNFDFTLDKFKKIVTNNPFANEWYEALCLILPDYDIDSVPRVAAFLAQLHMNQEIIEQLKKT